MPSGSALRKLDVWCSLAGACVRNRAEIARKSRGNHAEIARKSRGNRAEITREVLGEFFKSQVKYQVDVSAPDPDQVLSKVLGELFKS